MTGAAAATALLVACCILLWPIGARQEGAVPRAAPQEGAVAARPEPHDSALRSPIPWWARLRRRHSRWRDPPVDVVTLLDALGAALRAGLTVPNALRATLGAGGARVVLSPVLQAAEEGRALGHEWARVARTLGDPHLAALARAWMTSERLGCPLADAVATAASSARSRRELSQRLDAATAGARATAAVLTVLPLAGMGLALMVGTTPADLYTSWWALASALVGVGLLVLGRWMVARMIARVATVLW